MDLRAVEKILVVKLSSLGDIVHVTPCLRALRRACPRARIFMAVERRFAAVVRHNPNLDGLIEAGHEPLGRVGRFFAVRSLLVRHSRPRFDLALDFQGQPRSALWVYLSRAAVQVGFGGRRPGWQCVLRPDLTQHSVVDYARLVQSLGIAINDLEPEIVAAPEADATVEKILACRGVPPRGFLLLNPFGRCRARRWPLERYAALIQHIQRSVQVPIVVSGWRDEFREAERLRCLLNSPAPCFLVGSLTLEEAICLYRRAALMVTGDSGPMHVAAALGTPVIALFGPSLPERNGPWGAGHCVLQNKKPTHHHAFLSDRQHEFIRALDVASVQEAVVQALERLRARVTVEAGAAA